MYIPLDHDSKTPLPRQISAYLEGLIRRGHLGPEGRLPATRTLAAELGVNKKTVEAAYDELAARDLVRVRAGRGVVVRARIPEDPELDLGFREPRHTDPLPRAAWVLPAREPERMLDLAGVGPRAPVLSSRALRALYEQALATSRGPLFSAPPPLGESTLRAAAARHLARSGVLLGAEETAVLPGRRAAMACLLRLFVPRGGLVLAERLLDPELALPIRERRARVVVLPEGEDERSLSAAVRRAAPRLLVVETGSSRVPGPPPGIARRRALLDLARTRGIPVVEDLTRAEAPGGAPPPAPLHVLEPAGRVLALADLSDELGGDLPATAVGGSAKALDRIRTGRDPSLLPAPRLAQRALALALDSPSRTRTRASLAERRRLGAVSVARSLRRRLPASPGHELSRAADAVRIDLPDGTTGTDVQEAARERGVLVRSARDCGALPSADRFLLVDLTRHDEGELLEGIRLLGDGLDEVLART